MNSLARLSLADVTFVDVTAEKLAKHAVKEGSVYPTAGQYAIYSHYDVDGLLIHSIRNVLYFGRTSVSLHDTCSDLSSLNCVCIGVPVSGEFSYTPLRRAVACGNEANPADFPRFATQARVATPRLARAGNLLVTAQSIPSPLVVALWDVETATKTRMRTIACPTAFRSVRSQPVTRSARRLWCS
jgi:hypothetical protein